MRVHQSVWTQSAGWKEEGSRRSGDSAQLVLVFGETSILRMPERLLEIRSMYPGARILGCSTAGEILGVQVLDDSLVATAVFFETTEFQLNCLEIARIEDSARVGQELARSLDKEGLVHVFVLSDGLNVNGSSLVKGLLEGLPSGVTLTGGLSGDKDRFRETLVLCDGEPKTNLVAVLGLYGRGLRVGYGSLGGWDPFGPERLVTRSDGNILYELDGKSALGLYKMYLGEHAQGLPATALLFPLSIRSPQGQTRLVRTILSVDENSQSMIFAGDVPEGAYAQFMKANFNRVIDGAVGAAKLSQERLSGGSAELALLISCVGRKMVLKQRVEEEVEGVRDILGQETALAGFYSYGEISPSNAGGMCELHNQTMTITIFSEQ